MTTESNLVAHARHELALIGSGDEPMQKAINEHIMKVVQLFADEGHSGLSASYAVAALEKLLRFEPLKPLTGADDEWNEVGSGVFQNRRCSHVFKENGVAYDINAVVFREASGATFTNWNSRRNIEFPYTPKTEYVDVADYGAEYVELSA